MSYDIELYVGLGIKVRDILGSMDENDNVQICDYDNYVQINESLIEEYKNLASTLKKDYPEISTPTPDELSQISLSQYDDNMRGYFHATSCVALTMLSLCGVKPKFLKEGLTCFELSLFPYGNLFVPTGAPTTCPSGFDYIACSSGLFNDLFIPALDESNLISVYETEYDDEGEVRPKFDISMAKSLTSLLDAQTATKEDGHNYGPERLMHSLIDKYLEGNGIYQNITVISTRYGDVHDLGGMEQDEPYVIFGDLDLIDKDGWNDPREDEELAEGLEQIKQALVGEDHEGFSVLEPKFGG